MLRELATLKQLYLSRDVNINISVNVNVNVTVGVGHGHDELRVPGSQRCSLHTHH